MKTYFANDSIDDVLPKLVEKVKDYNQHCERSGKRERWEKCHKFFYGEHLGESGRSTTVSNVDNVLKAFGVNHFRNLIKHSLAIATSQKPTYDPRAKNTDLKSLQQARLANNIIDAYVTEKRLGRHQQGTAERSIVYSLGFMYMPWEPSLGRAVGVQTVPNEQGEQVERVMYEGDIAPVAKTPFDVFHDVNLKDWSKIKWVIVREYENRWDLASRYPKFQDQILNIDDAGDLDMRVLIADQSKQDKENDMIAVYHFYHLRTDACPNGRYVKFIDERTALFDGPIPYRKRLPIFRMAPGDVFDSADGYSESLDILVLQQVLNTLDSTAFNNQSKFGLQMIHLPQGCEIGPEAFQGLAFLKGGPPGTEPKAIQLTASPPELFKFREMTENTMTKLMGLNKVVTGDPDSNLKSGVALARLQAMAIQYSSTFQKSWAELLEDTGTFLLELLQDFANTERMVALAGKHNKGAMASFTGKDLDMIERVAVDLGNPIQNTSAGRIEMAESLLAKGAINAKQYIQVATTGNIESVTEATQSQSELIRKENEALMEGMPVKAMVGDAHILHAQEHMTVINDPGLREAAANGDQMAVAVLDAVTQHVLEHKQFHETQDPFFTMLSGEPPPPPPPMPQGPPPEGMPQDPNAPPMPPPPGMSADMGAPPPAPMPGPANVPPAIPQMQ